MSIEEFERYYRESMSSALNQLQRMTLLSSNLQETVDEINTSLQRLNQTTEDFIQSQRQNSEDGSGPVS